MITKPVDAKTEAICKALRAIANANEDLIYGLKYSKGEGLSISESIEVGLKQIAESVSCGLSEVADAIRDGGGG